MVTPGKFLDCQCHWLAAMVFVLQCRVTYRSRCVGVWVVFVHVPCARPHQTWQQATSRVSGAHVCTAQQLPRPVVWCLDAVLQLSHVATNRDCQALHTPWTRAHQPPANTCVVIRRCAIVAMEWQMVALLSLLLPLQRQSGMLCAYHLCGLDMQCRTVVVGDVSCSCSKHVCAAAHLVQLLPTGQPFRLVLYRL